MKDQVGSDTLDMPKHSKKKKMHLMLQHFIDTGNLDEYAWLTTREFRKKGKGAMFISLDSQTQSYFTVKDTVKELEEAKEEQDAEGAEFCQEILDKIDEVDFDRYVLIMVSENQKVAYVPVLKRGKRNDDTDHSSKTNHRVSA